MCEFVMWYTPFVAYFYRVISM